MKKIILMLMIFLCVPFIMNASVVSNEMEDTFKAEGIQYDLSNYEKSSDKVNVYLFRGEGCPHCVDFLEFVSNTLVKEYGDYFNLITYEVWKNSDNADLKARVVEHLGIDASKAKGVPFIVIGENYFSGYGSSRDEAIINLIKSEYEKTDRRDVVLEVLNMEEEPKDFFALVFVGVIVLVLTALLVLLFIPKKSKKVD